VDSPLIFQILLFLKFLSMARRVKAIRATVSMKIALSEPLLALVNNYVKALRFTLFWLKENVPNPMKGSAIQSPRGVVRGVKGGIQSAIKGRSGLLP
jgi:hypothetical protein